MYNDNNDNNDNNGLGFHKKLRKLSRKVRRVAKKGVRVVKKGAQQYKKVTVRAGKAVFTGGGSEAVKRMVPKPPVMRTGFVTATIANATGQRTYQVPSGLTNMGGKRNFLRPVVKLPPASQTGLSPSQMSNLRNALVERSRVPERARQPVAVTVPNSNVIPPNNAPLIIGAVAGGVGLLMLVLSTNRRSKT